MPHKDPEKHREYQRRYQREWSKRNRDRLNRYRANVRNRQREVIREAKADGCVRCGESDHVCLDFHHPNDDKEFNIGDIAHHGWGPTRLRQEIARCVVVCANCHRKLHAGRYTL